MKVSEDISANHRLALRRMSEIRAVLGPRTGVHEKHRNNTLKEKNVHVLWYIAFV